MAQPIAARATPPISKPRSPNLWLSFRILKIQQHYELAGREHRTGRWSRPPGRESVL